MSSLFLAACASIALLVAAPTYAVADNITALTLRQALARALSTNPKLTAAERDIGIAAGRRDQAAAVPNPELSLQADNILGSGEYRGLRSAEISLQLSQIVELGGKRLARTAAGNAQIEVAAWQRQAARLEVLSDTVTAFVAILAAQRRMAILQQQIAELDRLTPLLQKRVEAGASSPAETLRAQVAANLVRAQLERARTGLNSTRRDLALLMAETTPSFGPLSGAFDAAGRLPSMRTIIAAIDGNPQLMRWTAERAQRQAELLVARIKPTPDLRLAGGVKHFRDSGDTALNVGVSIVVPVWDQNLGEVRAASEALDKVRSERAINRAALIGVAGRAYDAAEGAVQEIALLRRTVIPQSREAAQAIEDGYLRGRFTLMELLDARSAVAEALLREQEALQSFHTSIATIEGLTGSAVALVAGGR